jgi:hypothetical protein
MLTDRKYHLTQLSSLLLNILGLIILMVHVGNDNMKDPSNPTIFTSIFPQTMVADFTKFNLY